MKLIELNERLNKNKLFLKVHNNMIYVFITENNEQVALINLDSRVALYYDKVSSQVKNLLDTYAKTGQGMTSRLEKNQFIAN